jgi:hypothetical protein
MEELGQTTLCDRLAPHADQGDGGTRSELADGFRIGEP